jgi:mono/diheme cytochrome c family protein
VHRIQKAILIPAALAVLLAIVFAAKAQIRPRMTATEAVEAERGKAIYNQKCEVCHFTTSTEKKIGPGLEGLMKREKFSNGMKATATNLQRVIERGGKDMPGFRSSLSDEQIRELIAYVKTL